MTTARYQNPNAQVQEGIAVAHTIHGEHASGTSVNPTAHGVQEGRIRAVPQAHQRNYQPPKRRKKDNPEIQLCGADGCKAYPSKKFHPYCPGHARSLGLPGADWISGRKKKVVDDDAG